MCATERFLMGHLQQLRKIVAKFSRNSFKVQLKPVKTWHFILSFLSLQMRQFLNLIEWMMVFLRSLGSDIQIVNRICNIATSVILWLWHDSKFSFKWHHECVIFTTSVSNLSSFFHCTKKKLTHLTHKKKNSSPVYIQWAHFIAYPKMVQSKS